MQREPTPSELRQATGISTELFDEAEAAAGVSLVRIVGSEYDGPGTWREPADPGEPFTSAIERDDFAVTMRLAIKELPEKERSVVGLYFVQRLTRREISATLSLSETRVSQLLGRAFRLLRQHPTIVQSRYPVAA